MSNWHEKQITLRGFLYRDQQGQLILSHEPNLRSCCVGKKEKQVIVFPKNNFSEFSKSALTLKGRFVVDAQGYSLHDAEIY